MLADSGGAGCSSSCRLPCTRRLQTAVTTAWACSSSSPRRHVRAAFGLAAGPWPQAAGLRWEDFRRHGACRPVQRAPGAAMLYLGHDRAAQGIERSRPRPSRFGPRSRWGAGRSASSRHAAERAAVPRGADIHTPCSPRCPTPRSGSRAALRRAAHAGADQNRARLTHTHLVATMYDAPARAARGGARLTISSRFVASTGSPCRRRQNAG